MSFEEFTARIKGIGSPKKLRTKIFTEIGLGSGGSAIALNMARCGMSKFNLFDFDVVETSNLCRSVYDVGDIGRKKTETIRNKILAINPEAEVKLFDVDVLRMPISDLEKVIDESDLIVEASDDVKTKILINGLACMKVPVLYPAVYDGGSASELLFTIPGKTPCYQCVMSSIIPQMEQVKRGEVDYSTGRNKPMAALIADIQVIVARTTKLALAMLLANEKRELLEKVTVPDCSILFVGNEKDFFIFSQPFQEVWAQTEINPDCFCRQVLE